MSVAYVLDDVFAEHLPPADHPERPERFIAVRNALKAANLPERGTHLPTRAARDDEIGLIHEAAYFDELSRTMPGRSGWLDGDTYFSPRSWDAVLAAAGAAVDVTIAVLSGEHSCGMAIVRPPGHHAEADRAMGFCLFNNVAIAAAAARAAGANRVAIVDWDVHHGNGTQHSFETDPDVLYLSCHQYPFYPGTGSPNDVGRGAGIGATVNVGMPAGCGDGDYAAVFDEVFLSELRLFRPDVIIISAGFDAYVDDPLASMRVTKAGYRRMADALVGVADEVANGRIVCVLEGGYDLDGLAGGVVAVLDAMDGCGAEAVASAAPAPSGHVRAAIEATQRALEAARAGGAG